MALSSQIVVWCGAFDRDSSADAATLAQSLSQEGIQTHGGDIPSDAAMAALCCREPTSEVRATVRRMTARGTQAVVIARTFSPISLTEARLLLEAGASDLLTWAEPDVAKHLARRFQRWTLIKELSSSPTVLGELVGGGAMWRATLAHLVEISCFANGPLLLTGETGTGKELVARFVHRLDPRPDKGDFVILDCTTVVPELSGSEFFGHERGAFTGAVSARDGAFALADGGTLFLDEVAELPPPLQAQLLRVIQEKTFKRVGGNAWQRTKFRLICATHKDLLREVREGRFRHDLYYRIASATCHLPPLRERRDDIPLLAKRFWQDLREEELPTFDDSVLEFLASREYPGNVRDLKQLIARMTCRHVSGPVTIGTLPADECAQPLEDHANDRACDFDYSIETAVRNGFGLKEISRHATEAAVQAALTIEAGSIQRAAKLLGVTDRALQMRLASTRRNGSADETPKEETELL